MPAPTVSVIVPTYNRADLISQAIDSVLQQTFSDFEIIVVDDGSTDDTGEIVKSYGHRVRYVWTPNGGAGHARNVGTEHANGRYLTFLDSDDLLYPYALELETRLLERFPAVAMVCAEVTGFDDRGFNERYHLKNYHKSSFRDPAVTYDSIFPCSMPLLETGVIPASVLQEDPTILQRKAYYGNVFDSYILRIVLFTNSSMLRREVATEVGRRSEHIFNFEDFDYLLRLSRKHDVLFADVPTYKLRYHMGQLSNEGRSDGKVIWMRKQRALLRIIKRQALADEAYYRQYKERLDRHLADLHRAAAIPLLWLEDPNWAPGRHRRHARQFLRRCRSYGHPARLLYAATFLPGPIRRLSVSIIEGFRKEGSVGVLRRGARFLAKRLRSASRHAAK